MKVIHLPQVGDVAVGLSWSMWPIDKQITPDAIREHLDHTDSRSYCLCDVQGRHAIGVTPEEDVPVIPALAALASEARRGVWAGIFEVSGGYWVAGSIHGGPFPGFDIFTPNPEGAKKALLDGLQLIQAEVVILPSDMMDMKDELEDLATEISDLEFIHEETKRYFLRGPGQTLYDRAHEQFIRHKKRYVAASAVVGVVLLGWFVPSVLIPGLADLGLLDPSAEQKAEADEKRRAEKEARQRQIFTKATTHWRSQAPVEWFIRECASRLVPASEPIGGWSLSAQYCTPSEGGVIQFEKVWGKLEHAKKTIEGRGLDLHMVSAMKIRGISPFKYNGEMRPEVPLVQLLVARDALVNLGISSDMDVRFTKAEPAKIYLNSGRKVVQEQFKISGVWNLPSAAQALIEVPSLRLEKMAFDAAKNHWTLEGSYYAEDI